MATPSRVNAKIHKELTDLSERQARLESKIDQLIQILVDQAPAVKPKTATRKAATTKKSQ